MDFKIKHIILWPKDKSKKERILSFDLTKINVITGDSQKGKSSIIPIIDYCLGSSKCTIPVGIIREKTEWFGIVVAIKGELILLARKEPGIHSQSGDVFIFENVDLEKLPRPEAERNVEFLKNKLNEIATLPFLTLSDENDSESSNKRASFRDFSAFQFQPQHIVANPYTLFYKADTYQNRERLKNIFPLVLGAIDKEILYLRQQLKELEKEHKQKQNELSEIKKINSHWFYNLKSYYAQAKEYGLLLNPSSSELGWSTQIYISQLLEIPKRIQSQTLSFKNIDTQAAVTELSNLFKEELNLSHEIGSLRQRLYKMTRLFESEKLYQESLDAQQERLQPSNWLVQLLEPKTVCPFCGSENSKAHDEIHRLYNYQSKISSTSNNIEKSSAMLDREIVKLRIRLKELESSLNFIRKQRTELEIESEEVRRTRQTEQEIFRFIGRLEKSLSDYKLTHENNDLEGEVKALEEQIFILKRKIDPKSIEAKLKLALNTISEKINRYADFLGVEDADQPIELDITNLTLKKKSGQREDYLWEIGSGANWMGYHIATLLALHEFLIDLKWNPVPQFLIIDQPSQVYFPEKIVQSRSEDPASAGGIITPPPAFRQEDVIRVQKIFSALSTCLRLTKHSVQLIIIEHADQDTWSGTEQDIHVAERWRGEKEALIPEDWL